MQEIIICAVALFASGLTFFSGFGLGTILLPVFALFFPVEVAIALTAIVHFLNNVFKFFLVGKNVDKQVLLRFGIPAIAAAFLGAYLLNYLSEMKPFYEYGFSGKSFQITAIKVIIAVLLIFFALFDLIPRLKNLQFGKKYLPLGGLVSGFFGGLSGHQGALRSAFLIRAGLSKEAFIATGIAIACLIDISRLSVYSEHIIKNNESLNWNLVILATLSAFAGAFLGNKLLKKITISFLQKFVAVALIVFSVFLGLGVL
ncbi:sulfite exporter TauE/SafE family protein [Chryseobacterium suipulveris]|uniref:Probable membrane transporter protein n=1 Tax=Chryseobacterium suipulveris TaxID=2929800 RepID=A0ABY4BNY7_9FLAO|nr:sulfite exporter TauE/SafE family protein [Chryseobacterium suipulveris]UOE40887.1 sulfite exporter TauE/SafE family protein [Chryseobacterium suipulveris]